MRPLMLPSLVRSTFFGGLLFLLASASGAATPANAAHPIRVSSDVPAGELPGTELLTWALRSDSTLDASAVDERVRKVLDAFRNTPSDGAHDDIAVARGYFHILHQRFLTGEFDAPCAQLSKTLETGAYNCLTATLIYVAACRDTGIRATALAAPHHVCVRLHLANGDWIVETTLRDWNARSASPPALQLRPIDDRALLSRLYYNRAIGLAAREHWEAALHSAQISVDLDPLNPLPRDNLLAIINNYCRAAMQMGAVTRAAALAQTGLTIDPEHGSLRQFADRLKEFDSGKKPE